MIWVVGACHQIHTLVWFHIPAYGLSGRTFPSGDWDKEQTSVSAL